jgi:hypothetical protein
MNQDEILKSPKLQMEAALIRKCSEDPDFRAKVLENPKGMLEEALGQKLPENVSIFVHQEDLRTLHFSIPPLRSDLEKELTDEQLEQIAGGTIAPENNWPFLNMQSLSMCVQPTTGIIKKGW